MFHFLLKKFLCFILVLCFFIIFKSDLNSNQILIDGEPKFKSTNDDFSCSILPKVKNISQSLCSGTLISENIIVSAKHCFKYNDAIYEIGCGFINKIGKIPYFYYNATVDISKIFTSNETDYAFIKLPSKTKIKPAMLPLNRIVFTSNFFIYDENEKFYKLSSLLDCKTAGFGYDKNNNVAVLNTYEINSNETLYLVNKVINNNLLLDLPNGSEERLIMQVAKSIILKEGDSGGGLYCRLNESDDWTLIGVISTGANNDKGNNVNIWVATGSSKFNQIYSIVNK